MMGISATVVLPMEPLAAFDAFVDELTSALALRGIHFDTGPNGRMTDSDRELARVRSWQPGNRILLEWHPPEWRKDAKTINLVLRFEPIKDGTHITLDQSEWGSLFDGAGELAGWFAGEVAATILQAMAPTRFGDWITDRSARRPSGAQARATYRNPVYHMPNFLAILNMLQLKPNDYLLEVGCGGGAFLREALRSGCRAAAIDHSSEMVRLASDANRDAIAEGRLIIRNGEADRLPYADETFTCAVMTGVFGFLQDPVTALSEIYRLLTKNGRLVIFTGSKELRGTPAAPEPIASRLRFYEDGELEQLAHEAGFREARVERPDLEGYARQSGVPTEALPLFSGRTGQFLIALKG